MNIFFQMSERLTRLEARKKQIFNHENFVWKLNMKSPSNPWRLGRSTRCVFHERETAPIPMDSKFHVVKVSRMWWIATKWDFRTPWRYKQDGHVQMSSRNEEITNPVFYADPVRELIASNGVIHADICYRLFALVYLFLNQSE